MHVVQGMCFLLGSAAHLRKVAHHESASIFQVGPPRVQVVFFLLGVGPSENGAPWHF